jgi:hypothetical protein
MMSKSDEVLAKLVAATLQNGGFIAAWERIGDEFRLKATGQKISKVWANELLQRLHPGSDIDALFPPPRVVPMPKPVVKKAVPASAAKPAGTLSAAQWRSIIEADAAAEGRKRRR